MNEEELEETVKHITSDLHHRVTELEMKIETLQNRIIKLEKEE